MYESIEYFGYTQSFKRLWLYTRTLIENPKIGLFVQHATFRSCYINGYREHEGAHSDRLGRRDNRGIISLGCEIGFKAEDLSRALQAKKRFPLMPIIISKLQNLITLSLYLKDSDSYHHELDKVLAVPGSFARLRDVVLTLQPKSNIPGRDTYGILSRSGLCYTPRVIFSKESVKNLVIKDAHFHNWQGLDAFEKQHVSNVTHLSIHPAMGSYEVYRYLPRIIQLPRMLVSLTLSLESLHFEDTTQDDRHRMPSCHEIWEWLGVYKACLKHLDFYRMAIPMPDVTINPRIRQGSQMGSLAEFQELQSLSIQPEVLLGHSIGGENMQVQLKEKLPISLVSLTLYADESLALDASLEYNASKIASRFPQ